MFMISYISCVLYDVYMIALLVCCPLQFSLPLPQGGRDAITKNPILREDQLPQKFLYPKKKNNKQVVSIFYFLLLKPIFVEFFIYFHVKFCPLMVIWSFVPVGR